VSAYPLHIPSSYNSGKDGFFVINKLDTEKGSGIRRLEERMVVVVWPCRLRWESVVLVVIACFGLS
jgi:hypothetical protein